MAPLTPTKKKKIRESISAYCAAARANELNGHYSQQRPFGYYDHIGVGPFVLDCSGFVGNTFWNAMHDTGIYIADPLDFRYTGYGNTTSLEAYLRRNGKRVTEVNGYLVGDVARYGVGNLAHATICSRSGTAKTSRWTSHGSEAGPLVVKLGYRKDIVGVWRHPELL